MQEVAKKKLFVNIFLQKIDNNINLIELTNFFSQKNKKISLNKKIRKAGFLKGGIKHMADDFDAPMKDFND
ncbi:MAG: hypothetical protein B6I24_08085 [Bacteroidetes bacterium 4572_128]|nr:MAG: hypothetical protein B6I24_08085 [Bacteroidetes bacterium 4572_128]